MKTSSIKLKILNTLRTREKQKILQNGSPWKMIHTHPREDDDLYERETGKIENWDPREDDDIYGTRMP